MIRVDKQVEAYLPSRSRLISFLYEREAETEAERLRERKGREGGRKEGRKRGREGWRERRGREGKMDRKLMCTPVHLKTIFKALLTL